MYLKKVEIKNFKWVKKAEVTFLPVINKITGKNWSGKSTIIDAILFAMVWRTYFGKWVNMEKLVTKWEERAEIKVKVWDSERTISVTRMINQSGDVYLEAVDSEANKLTQKDLDALLSQYTIDPLEFSKKSNKEKFELIQQITGCDTKDFDEDYKKTYELRTNANAIYRSHKANLESLAESLSYDAEWNPVKVDRVSVSELMAQLEDVQDHNATIRWLAVKREAAENRIKANNETIEELKNKIKSLEENNWLDADYIKEYNAEIKKLWWPKDDTTIRSQLQGAEEENKKATNYEKRVDQQKLTDEAQQKATDLDNQVKAIEKAKADKIKSAKMPVDWMEFNEQDWIVIDWIPFDQHSTAQQIIIASRIATFTNPELKVIVIKDWSLLDDDSTAEIEKFAEDNGYQIYMEVVNDWVFGTIIMRQGEVVDQE